MKGHKAVLTVNETAQLLGISRNAAYQGVRCGEIPSFKVGKRILIPRIAFEKMLQEPKNASSGRRPDRWN